MSAITESREWAIISLQRHFRHRRYLKNIRSQDKWMAYERPLFIREIQPAEFPFIKTIVENWKHQADAATRIVLSGIHTDLKEGPHQCIGAFGDYRKLQGIMICGPSKVASLEIEFIAVAPHNRTIVPRFKRVGTALIEEAIHLASREPQPNLISLIPINNSALFYQKLFFDVNSHFKEESRIPFLTNFGGRALPIK